MRENELHEQFRRKEFETYDELLDYVIHELEKYGLKKSEADKLKQAREGLPMNIDYPHLKKEWLNPNDEFDLELAIITLAAVNRIENSGFDIKKRNAHRKLIDSLYPDYARKKTENDIENTDEENDESEEEEVGWGMPHISLLAVLSYKHYAELISDQNFIDTICPDKAEQGQLKTPEGLIDFLAGMTDKDSNNINQAIYHTFLLYLQEMATKTIQDKNGNTIYEFDLNLKREESEFLEKWLREKKFDNKVAVPGGVAIRQPYKSIVYFFPLHKNGFTKEHEHLHLESDGFATLGNLGSGLDEGMTELLAQEKAFSRRNPVRRIDAWLHHQVQDSFHFGKRSKDLGKRIKGYLLAFYLDSTMYLRHQSYLSETSLLLRLFKRHQRLRPIFEQRYFNQTKHTVLHFAVEVINELGVDMYLSLFQVQPYREEISPTGLIGAQEIADKI